MIQAAKSLVDQAKRDIGNLQSGKTKLVKTGFSEIDNSVGGLMVGDCVTIAALSSHGKTFYLEKLKKNIMSKEYNEDSENYVSLSYNLEMRTMNLVLRGLAEATGVSKKDILKKPFEDKVISKAKEFTDFYSDYRNYICQEPLTPEDFYTQTKEFVKEHVDKSAIIISVDHLSLIVNSRGSSGKTENIGQVIEYMNKLKLEFNNIYFINILQLNRNLLTRLGEKSNDAFARESDLENSSAVNQISSYTIILVNAQKLNINEYGSVNPEFYSYISNHFSDQANGLKKVSFLTENRIFKFVVKSREASIGFKNIYIDYIGGNTPSQAPKSNKQIINEIESPSFESLLKPNTDFEDEEDGPF